MKLQAKMFVPDKSSILAFLLGITLSLGFAPLNLSCVGWVIPGLMGLLFLHFLKDEENGFKHGWIAGMGFWMCTLHWLLFIPYLSGALLGWVSLSAYMACYMGIWSWSLRAVRKCLSSSGIILFGGATWAILEWIRGWLFTGFSWNYLPVSQHENWVLVQIVSITGIYFLSFVMVVFSMGWVNGFYDFFRAYWHKTIPITAEKRKIKNHTFFTCGILATFVLAGIYFYGLQKSQRHTHDSMDKTTPQLRVALLQPSIPQTLIWNRDEAEKNFQDLLRDTRQLVGTNTVDLIVFPEGAVPGYVRYEEKIASGLVKLTQELKAPLIFNGDDIEPNDIQISKKDTDKATFKNCAFLMDQNGSLEDRYVKQHLVVFGEYVPLSEYLPFLKMLTPIGGNYTVGTEHCNFTLSQPECTLAPLICFEDVFPEEARRHVNNKTDAFIYLVNAGWFGASCAQEQHLSNAKFRCIENGIPAIRCSNNGVTCWIDTLGRAHDIIRDANGSIHSKGGIIAEIPISHNHKETIYHQRGNVLLLLFVYIVFRAIILIYIKTRKKNENQ